MTVITPPRIVDDYYGPNEFLKQHLSANPRSWKTVHREAQGNDLQVKLKGGTLIRNYPLMIQVENPDDPELTVDITGGVGFVPIRLEGLKSVDGLALHQVVNGSYMKLDQSVFGNDYWQTDYDTETKTYRLIYNLPLDGLEHSQWKLSSKPLDSEASQ